MTIGLGELITVGIALIGAIWGLLTVVFRQFEKHLTKQFEALEEDAKQWAQLERDFLVFQRDLPLNYVRREDYVRNQTVIESKLDSLALKLENWQLKEVAKREH